MLHKPVGFITTLDDPEGRLTVRQLMPPGPRLFPVGRLDADSSGLLLLTNDGDLAHHLMHPRYGVPKLYRVTLGAPPEDDALRRLRAGVEIEPGVRSGPAEVRIHSERRDRVAIELKIQEGRYREVRKMCEAVGLDVRRLHRFGYGPLRLDKLPNGACRELSGPEVQRLRAAGARPGGAEPGAIAVTPGRAPRRDRPKATTPPTGASTRTPPPVIAADTPSRRPPRRAVRASGPAADPSRRRASQGRRKREPWRSAKPREGAPRARQFTRGSDASRAPASARGPGARPRRAAGRPGRQPVARSGRPLFRESPRGSFGKPRPTLREASRASGGPRRKSAARPRPGSVEGPRHVGDRRPRPGFGKPDRGSAGRPRRDSRRPGDAARPRSAGPRPRGDRRGAWDAMQPRPARPPRTRTERRGPGDASRAKSARPRGRGVGQTAGGSGLRTSKSGRPRPAGRPQGTRGSRRG
jgi:23S rRNA pseudouridine2605 synthase